MEKKEILEKLQDIYRDVLDNDEIVIMGETTADDIEEWDSLAHIQIVNEVENQFCIKFTSYEITSWIDIADLVDCISSKLTK